jgi:hypothetical protein
VETCFRAIRGRAQPERPHSFSPPRQSPPADAPRGALSQGIGPHGPPYVPWMTLPPRRAHVKPICGTRLPPLIASATQDNHTTRGPAAGSRASRPPRREARGAGLGAGTRVRERRTRSRLQARRVYRLANRSRKHAVCGAGTRPSARVGTARAGGRVTRHSGRLFIVDRVTPVEAGRAARGDGRRPTNDHRSGAIAAPSPPGPPGTTSTGFATASRVKREGRG